ncbi:kinesin-like protein KIFC3 [Python bivittatus]|uniref:Kinesin-like protein KIFC3 n=1 Tax=Python bivittatus TaxID=176946 RepID=A0A9F5J321_PYTBI|nr:kinesin-like protein KIFC3 [Python bivittatus]
MAEGLAPWVGLSWAQELEGPGRRSSRPLDQENPEVVHGCVCVDQTVRKWALLERSGCRRVAKGALSSFPYTSHPLGNKEVPGSVAGSCVPAAGHRASSEEPPQETSKSPLPDLWLQLTELDSSSESDGGSPLEEDEPGWEEPPESPLIQVMLHLLSFLERYTQMQQLQEKAGEYRSRLRQEESQWRRQLRGLKRAYQQRVRDKLSVIESLEAVILEQQGLLEKMQGGTKLPPSTGLLCPVAPGGLHQLVETVSALQGERSRLAEEVVGLQQRMEEREREKQQLARSFHLQIEGLKQQIQAREEEREQLRLGTGVTDSEKRIYNLTVENEGLKQGLRLSQGLLQQAAAVSTQPSALVVKENEALRSKVLQLEASLQQKVEELVRMEARMDQLQWRKEEEVRQLDRQLCGLQLSLEAQKNRPSEIQYITKVVEADSPQTLQALAKAEEQNRVLMQQLSCQAQRCQRLAEQLQGSEGAAVALRHKISAYEKEVSGLRQELLHEIGLLEAQKEEAVQEASRCSEQQAQPLREQLAGMKQHLDTLHPLLRGLQSDLRSLRGEMGSFASCYEAAIEEAKLQMCSVIKEVANTSHSLQERYQREVHLRKKYHDQLLELKGNIRVLCRLKPLTEDEQQGGPGGAWVEASPAEDGCVTACYKGKEHSFRLDKVFLPCATQEEVFLEIEPVVVSCLYGYNVCIFAYGQTGSGKTYTMEGLPGNPGINQRALQALYQEMEAKEEEAWKYSVSLTMVEIYNEVIRDLLTKDPQEKLDIKLHPDGSGQLHVPGLTSVEVQSLCEVQKILLLGKRNRTTFSTNMNAHSSRSHALLTLTLTGTDLTSGTKCPSRQAESGGPGRLRTGVEIWRAGGASEGSPEHQPVPAGPGRGDPGPPDQAGTRAFPQLQAHLPVAGLLGQGQQDGHDGADFPPREKRGRIHLLSQVCPARLQGGTGPSLPPHHLPGPA